MRRSLGTRLFSALASNKRVLLFPGDGVGPEIVQSAVSVIEASGAKIEWTKMDMGFEAAKKNGGGQITETHLKAFEDIRTIFKGPLTIPPGNNYIEIRGKKYTSPNQVLRKVFNLYANIRPAKGLKGVKTPFPGVDLVIVRENTEDLYTGEERWVDKDTVEGIKRITRGASTRISETAWQYAINNKRKRITAVHKANVCKQADGLFLSVTKDVAAKYKHTGIASDDQLADSLLTKLVTNPLEFDILLCPNLFGDLVSDLAAGLIGSLGLMPSGQFGDGFAVFEPAHGSAPDIAGKGIVNPLSQIRTGVMMLNHLGFHAEADKIEKAANHVVNSGVTLTKDLGGKASTQEFTKAIIQAMK